MIADAAGIILNPRSYLKTLEDRHHGPYWGGIYAAVMSILPPLAFYWGTTVQGWSIGTRVIKIAPDNAVWLAIFFYLALVIGTIFIGTLFSWMSRTYTKNVLSPESGIETTALCATPIFMAGLAAIYPILWLDILLATAAAAYSIHLIYLSLHLHLKLNEEQSFIYTCAALAFILVVIVSIMGATAIAWEYIAAPVFLG